MSGNDARQPTRQVEEMVGHGEYGRGAFDEMTVPSTSEWREAQERDIQDPADVAVDVDELRNGGPTRTGGAVTTTGGTAGPASVRRLAGRRGRGKTAPITTGDANTSGMETPVGASTSDAASAASQVGNFTRR